MKEKDFHRLIEEQNMEEKNALRSKIVPNTKNAQVRNRKIAWVTSLASVCACLICLAIILPFVVKTEEPTPPAKRYCVMSDYVLAPAESTVKEYSESSGKNLLYIDWYDIADDVQTMWIVHRDDASDRICLEETLVNGETGDMVVLRITDVNTEVDYYVTLMERCEKDCDYNGVEIKWHNDVKSSVATFEHDGYRYIIELKDPMDEQDILDIAESMLA